MSERSKILKPSPTLAMAAKARDLSAQGKDVISLTVGEPDWPTFESARKAAVQSIAEGFTKYTASNGILELRQAISEQVQSELGISYQPSEIVVGAGAKFIIYALFQMTLDPGDEVIIPAPYWVSYPTMAEMAGAKCRFIDCTEATGFKMTAGQLQAAINSKTRALIFSSPSNPTGISYSPAEWKAIAEVLKSHPEIMIISDDIYDKLVFSDSANTVMSKNGNRRAIHLLDVAPELKNQIIIVNGASKTFSMTGWRIGWCLGDAQVMKILTDFMSQSTSNVTSISQKAALAALKAGPQELLSAVQSLEKKRNRTLEMSERFKFFKAVKPDGAFYIWMDVRSLFGKKHQSVALTDSRQIANLLLDQYFLATVPGIDFGTEGYLRLSIAASDKDLEKAWQRLSDFEAQVS